MEAHTLVHYHVDSRSRKGLFVSAIASLCAAATVMQQLLPPAVAMLTERFVLVMWLVIGIQIDPMAQNSHIR
jgi:urea transporter